MLSIIIPHYNSPGTLKKLLDSIPNTNGIEIIVVDDKSTQGLEEYQLLTLNPDYARASFLANTTDGKGPGICRNIGLDHAKGDWLLFADADDYFLPGFYEIVSKYLGSDCDAVFFTPIIIDLNTGEESFRHLAHVECINKYNDDTSRGNELRIRYNLGAPWSKLISAKLVKDNDIRFDTLMIGEDIAFSIRVGYYMKKFLASKEVIYCVTASSGSLVTQVSEHR
jgi:glycosyltransferase involved in cell wall biosynthesis